MSSALYRIGGAGHFRYLLVHCDIDIGLIFHAGYHPIIDDTAG